MADKIYLGINVLDAARDRIAWTFDSFDRIYVSFSGGKDSTAMLHLVMDEAKMRKRKVGVLFVDLEGQYKLTIKHIERCYDLYAEWIDPWWVAVPLHLRNAVSVYEPHWVCWQPDRQEDWIRQPPKRAHTDPAEFPFYKPNMEFEDFVEGFGGWYGGDTPTACLVGIRTAESLNRWRTIKSTQKQTHDGKQYTTWMGGAVYNVYPLYDWATSDIWTYSGKYGKANNPLYDLMHKAGLSIHQQRICQPYGDDQRKGLWLFHLIEPETWGRVVARVNGANQGALYARESGNILGRIKIDKPKGHTWESFARLLVESMPSKTGEHYRNKITVFLKWWQDRGYPNGIPDEADGAKEAKRTAPSWRRVCKALLRNDYWCKGLSFSQHKSGAYEQYTKVMKNRRRQWGLGW